MIEGACQAEHLGVCEMEIQRSRLDISMSEQMLDLQNVGPLIEQMGREAVAERMNGCVLIQTGSMKGLFENGLDRPYGSRLRVRHTRKQPVGGAAAFPVLAKEEQIVKGQDGAAVLVAFGLADEDAHVAAVDVGNLEMRSFADPEAGSVDGGENGPVLEVGSGGKQKTDITRRKNGGEKSILLHPGDVLHVPFSAEDRLIEKLDGAVSRIHISRTYFADGDRVMKKRPNLLVADLTDRIVTESLKPLHVSEICSLRTLGKATQLHGHFH